MSGREVLINYNYQRWGREEGDGRMRSDIER